MSETKHNKDISSEAVVVWAGVIAKYNSIKNFTDDGDPIRLATDEELAEYNRVKNYKS